MTDNQKKRGISRVSALATLLAATFIFITLTAGAQSRVSISGSGKTIEQVFREIEKQAGVRFAFNRSKFNASKKVTVNQTDAPLDDVIKAVLANTNFSHKKNGKYIIIYPTPTKGLWGVVTDKDTGIPIDSAEVSIFGQPDLKTLTDEEGKFNLLKVPVGDQRIVVTASGYNPNYRSTNVIENKESSINVTLKLQTPHVDSLKKEDFLLEEYVPVYVISTEKPADSIKRVIAQPETIKLPEIKPLLETTKTTSKYPKFAIKTNILLLATTSPNLGLEYAISDKLSIELSASFNPWKLGELSLNHFMIQPELRYWFSRPFEGHFGGIHGIYIGVNDAGGANNIPAIKNWYATGHSWGLGLSYGYHFSLGGRWGLELTIGAGFLNHSYDAYKIVDNEVVSTEKYNQTTLAPTKIGASLVYIIK